MVIKFFTEMSGEHCRVARSQSALDYGEAGRMGLKETVFADRSWTGTAKVNMSNHIITDYNIDDVHLILSSVSSRSRVKE